MTNANCGWVAEEIVDLLLGNLPQRKQERLLLHLETCNDCHQLREEWETVLPPPESDLPLPSNQLRLSLQPMLVKRGLRQRLGSSGSWRAAAMSITVILILLTFTWIQPWNSPGYSLPSSDGIEGISLLSDPQAIVYPVERPNQNHFSGFVWFNGSSNRVLIVLEGMIPSSERVFQAWAVSRNGYSNIGVLKHSKGRTYLYFEGKQLEQADNIMVSIEPKGGSLSPSKPEIFVISLHRSQIRQFHKLQHEIQQEERYDNI